MAWCNDCEGLNGAYMVGPRSRVAGFVGAEEIVDITGEYRGESRCLIGHEMGRASPVEDIFVTKT